MCANFKAPRYVFCFSFKLITLNFSEPKTLRHRLLKHPQAKFCPLVSVPRKKYATLALELSSMLQLPRAFDIN